MDIDAYIKSKSLSEKIRDATYSQIMHYPDNPVWMHSIFKNYMLTIGANSPYKQDIYTSLLYSKPSVLLYRGIGIILNKENLSTDNINHIIVKYSPSLNDNYSIEKVNKIETKNCLDLDIKSRLFRVYDAKGQTIASGPLPSFIYNTQGYSTPYLLDI